MKKIDKIAKDVEFLRNELTTQEPEHFGTKDVVYASFGALFIGLTFTLKGLLIDIAKNLAWTNITIIIITTLVLISLEIYFIGYSRVSDKRKRKPAQFILKRLLAVYIITFTVSMFLTNLFGLNYLVNNSLEDTFKIVFVLSMPCGIGAALADLLKKF